MKRLICAVALSGLAAGAWLAPALKAEDEAPPPAAHKMDLGKLKEKLGLSDEQMEKLKAARKSHEDAAKPLREEMKKAIETLRDQVKNKAPDADIQATLAQLTQNRKAMQDLQEKHRGEMEAILTPTQRAKMLLGMMKRMHDRGMGRGRGRGGKGHGEDSDHPGGPAQGNEQEEPGE